MTAKEIFEFIEKYSGENPTLICNLNSACKKFLLCSLSPNSSEILNFDKVETKWDSQQKRATKTSVDGLTYSSNNVLCFVELKSWYNFFYKEKKGEATPDDFDKKAQEFNIQLGLKLKQSIVTCYEILESYNFSPDIHIAYIILSDETIISEPIFEIFNNLTALSSLKPDLTGLSQDLPQKYANKISSYTTHHWQCKKFDSNLKSM